MTDFLAIFWNADPEIIKLGGFSLRWYSVLFVSGFIIGWYIFQWFFKRERLNPKLLDSLLVTLIVGTIIGARLGHCLFYQPDYYLGSWKGFAEIFMPWKGGLASHGGTLFLLFALWFYVRHYGKKGGFDFLWLLDHLCIAVSFAAAMIRFGNLFNSEIYGGPTNLPWGFIFARTGETEPHHPTQLYEAFSYILLGLVLLNLYKRIPEKLYRGTLIGLFFIGCFGSRFLIEFIKNDQVDFEAGMALNMGQLLSIPFILLGAGLLIYSMKKKQPAIIDGGFNPPKATNNRK